LKTQHEHEFEAAPGLPESLPAGERILWQGSPDWRQLAVHAFHVRKLAVYFLLMLALQAAFMQDQPLKVVIPSVMTSAVLALTALLMLSGIAWFASHTCLYTLTSKRVVMRVGIVLTMTFNLPLSCLSAAAIKPRRRGCGDIALKIKGSDRIAYLHLWPHARAWHLRQPQPSLRCVPQAEEVAHQILQAWRAANPTEALVTPQEAPSASREREPLSRTVTA
jgi:hypothetical protein